MLIDARAQLLMQWYGISAERALELSAELKGLRSLEILACRGIPPRDKGEDPASGPTLEDLYG